jgi:phosphatidylserine decarboxylase
MASLNAANVDKPIEVLTNPEASLPDADQNILADALESLVNHSADHPADLGEGLHASMYRVSAIPWLSKLIPGLERLAAEFHVGNFVAMRGSDERFFESMPLYARCVDQQLTLEYEIE